MSGLEISTEILGFAALIAIIDQRKGVRSQYPFRALTKLTAVRTDTARMTASVALQPHFCCHRASNSRRFQPNREGPFPGLTLSLPLAEGGFVQRSRPAVELTRLFSASLMRMPCPLLCKGGDVITQLRIAAEETVEIPRLEYSKPAVI